MTKPATVRYYFDADVLGLAKLVVQVRNDVTFPGDPGGTLHKRTRPPCPIATPATSDREWIPVVARAGWLVITRDSRIQDRPAEINAVREHGARVIALAGRDAFGTWQQLEILLSQWRGIEALHQQSGPFIFSASRSGLRRTPLT